MYLLNIFRIFITALFFSDIFIVNAKDAINIGIVGSGVTSLFLTKELVEKYGNSVNINIFEKGAWSSFDSCFTYNDGGGNIVELGTRMFASTLYKWDPITQTINTDLYKPLNELFIKYNISLDNMGFTIGYNLSNHELVPNYLQFLFNEFPPQLIVSQLLEISELLSSLQQFNTIQDLYSNGITKKGETFNEWSQRHNLPVIARLGSWSLDFLAGMAPTINASASRTLHILKLNSIGIIRDLLLNMDVTADKVPDLPFTKALLNTTVPSFYTLKEGFQHLWMEFANDLNQSNNVNIKYRSRVTSISGKKKKLQIEIDDKYIYKDFDFIILSGRASMMADILNERKFKKFSKLFKDIQVFPYYQKTLFQLNHNYSNLFPFNVNYAYYPIVNKLGTINVNEIYNCLPYYIEPNVFNNQILTVQYSDITNGYYHDNEYECRERIAEYLNNTDLWDINVYPLSDNTLSTRLWMWPNTINAINENNNWYKKMEDIQGTNGLFVIGDTIYGELIITVIEGVLYDIDSYFDVIERNNNLSLNVFQKTDYLSMMDIAAIIAFIGGLCVFIWTIVWSIKRYKNRHYESIPSKK